MRAQALVALGRLEEAEQCKLIAVDDGGRDRDLAYLDAILLEGRGDYAEAIVSLTGIPENYTGFFTSVQRGRLSLLNGDPKQALEWLEPFQDYYDRERFE